MPRPGIEPGLVDGDPAVLTNRLRSRWDHASYQVLKYPNCTILVFALTLNLHAGTFAWMPPYSGHLTTKELLCKPLSLPKSQVSCILPSFLSWSADLRVNHPCHWADDIPVSLQKLFSHFSVLVHKLTTYLCPLVCKFLNFTVSVNELTTY